MKKYKHTSIKNVVNWVSKRIDKNLASAALLEDLVFEAAESLMTYEGLQPNILFCNDLSSRRIRLPENFHYLYNIYYKPSINAEDVYNLKIQNLDITKDYNSPIITNSLSNHLQGYWDSNWYEIFPTQTNLIVSLSQEDESNQLRNCCEDVHYWYDKEKCDIVVSEKVGNIVILYLGYPYHEGNLLIPDEIEVFECIKDYVLKFLWEMRMNTKEQNAYNMYMLYHKKYLDSYNKAISKVRQLTPPEWKQLARTWSTGNKNLGFKL